MDRGTYAAASAGLMQLRKLEVASNNIANANTVGFKKQMLTGDTQTFDQTFAKLVQNEDPFAKPDHDRTPGATNARSITDFGLGSIRNTGNALDVALRDPRDFFVIQTPNGPQYTRAGNFTLNDQGQLVTQDGLPVEGDGGALSIEGGSPVISDNGSVSVNGTALGRLRVVRFENTSRLESVGGARFKSGLGAPAGVDVDASVVPQSLEMANVSMVSGMVDLITANRAFQSYTKSAETIDQMNQSAINQYGRRIR